MTDRGISLATRDAVRRLRVEPGPGPDGPAVSPLPAAHDRLADGLAADLRRRGPRLGRCAETIVEDPIDQVFVAVYDVTREDEAALDDWESAGTGLYRKAKVRVSTMSGELLVWTYVLDAYEGGSPARRTSACSPTPPRPPTPPTTTSPRSAAAPAGAWGCSRGG